MAAIFFTCRSCLHRTELPVLLLASRPRPSCCLDAGKTPSILAIIRREELPGCHGDRAGIAKVLIGKPAPDADRVLDIPAAATVIREDRADAVVRFAVPICAKDASVRSFK